jgi:putative FmdB family regulatory protein
MPIYEFKCTNRECNHIEEHLVRLSDPLPTNCEKCSSPTEKLVSQTSFALKGSGWYVTDYKGSNPGSSSATTQNAAEKSDSSTNTAPASAVRQTDFYVFLHSGVDEGLPLS